MKFSEVVEQARLLLQRTEKITYRVLKREFALDDEALEDLKEQFIVAEGIAVDQDGKVLVWVGSLESRVQGPESEKQKESSIGLTPDARRQTLDAAAERRQLTVLFCDLVGSTALSAQLDPEDYRAVVQQYQQTCAEVIQRHEGYLAQYLGDGLLVYFGYPVAHEDDARRAVRTGLEIIEALRHQVPSSRVGEAAFSPSPSKGEGWGEGETVPHSQNTLHLHLLSRGEKELQKLQVRIGIHTGLVVVGEIGSKEKRELLALGETPNVAARIQGLAEPNTVIVSAATQRLIDGQFESQPFGSHLVKGLDTPIAVYHVQSERQSLSPLAGKTTLTPLIGREQEVGLLIDRWEQTKEGRGQVVLLSGEPGIGKSRLAYTLREQVTREGSLLYEARCSPYHQHSALYPLIEVLQRTLLLTRQDSDSEKVEKLERALALYNLQESLPLFTALFSLPTSAQYSPLTLTPQKQKERTLQALLQLLVAQAERQATVSVWEDLHWADPSSLEFLSLLIEQIPTTKLLLVLTFRPEFTPPWKPRSHISQLVLNRLGKKHVEAMIEQVAESKNLSVEVIEQIRMKTDGVPLFVEELTKSVLESVVSRESKESGESPHRTPHQLAIPATLQEALLARLDRLSTARQVAQLGATLGREFSHELLQAVSPLSEPELQAALSKLVEAEILYQRGIGEQARYFFKHALIQDSAYQSLLKSTRQQYHQQIAQVLDERFPETTESQPELLAHHYTEAGLTEQAIPYWQRAGQRASEQSALTEAIAHLSTGLALLKTLPDSPNSLVQELSLQIALGSVVMAAKGYAAAEVEKIYARAHELCQQVGDSSQLFPVLRGLIAFYVNRAKLQTARDLGEQLLSLAHRQHDPAQLLEAHYLLALVYFFLGELSAVRTHTTQGLAIYVPRQYRTLSFRNVEDPIVACRSFAAMALWLLGYPEQALQQISQAFVVAQDLSSPFNRAFALGFAAWLHEFRCEEAQVRERAEAVIELSMEHGFPFWTAFASSLCGWAVAELGQEERGIIQLQHGIAAWRAIGTVTSTPYHCTLLAKAYRKQDRTGDSLAQLAEALIAAQSHEEEWWIAEVYRLKGQFTLQSKVQGPKSKAEKEAEEYFLKAIEVARKQQAKSLELRAVMSLSRLWQSQDKKTEAHQMLFEVYNWFTEGFDTKDLKEAKMLLEEMSH